MSFKYGGFFDSCTELEIISGTGEIIRCSKTEKPEIFDMIHGSFGTLGILTLLKFKLVPAKPYVRTDYITYPSFHLLMEAIREHQKHQDIEMMDAIVHAPDKCVLVVASFVDSAPYTHTYVWNIFYKSTLERKHDYMSTYEYLFRYDTECHWCTRNLGLENKALRALLGPFVLGSSNILHLAEKFPNFVKQANPPDVTVDVFIPESKVEEFWSWYLKTFNYFPLWIVPYYIPKVYPWINPNHVKGLPNTFYIDCAIYAFQQKDTTKNYYKLLEDKVFELQGIKTLITYNYYDEKTFWSWLNKENYQKVKQIVDPKNLLRELYAKTNYKSRH
jgi:FAD/FMN-containing dehydrogenase